MNKIRDFLREELSEKERLDCIGISLSNDRISELKGYHYSNHEIKRSGVASFCQTDGENARKHCRIKANNTKDLLNSIDLFAEEYGVSAEKWSLQPIKDLSLLVQEITGSPKILLCQAGIKLNNNEIEQLKLYITLRKFLSADDIKGCYQSINDSMNTISGVCKYLCIDNKYLEVLKRYAENVEKLMYYPSLLGVNLGQNMNQVKTYFELFETEYKLENLKEKAEELSDVFERMTNNSSQIVEEIIKVLMENGLFLRGFGVSNEKILRLYFALYERFV